MENGKVIYRDLYRKGSLGTPSNPLRGSTSKDAFWNCYFGLRSPAHYRNTLAFPAAVAGLAQAEADAV